MKQVRWLLGAAIGVLVAAQLFLMSCAATPVDTSPCIKIPSHGGSGVFIWTGKGKSYILTAAHLEGSQPITIHAPTYEKNPPIHCNKRFVAIDHQRDLALVEMDYGPVPYCSRVAKVGNYGTAISCGYDQMRWPTVAVLAKISRQDSKSIYTTTPPVPGRSGGPLFNSQGEVIGICQGYFPDGTGIYASTQSIHTFLTQKGFKWLVPENSLQLSNPKIGNRIAENIQRQMCPT